VRELAKKKTRGSRGLLVVGLRRRSWARRRAVSVWRGRTEGRPTDFRGWSSKHKWAGKEKGGKGIKEKGLHFFEKTQSNELKIKFEFKQPKAMQQYECNKHQAIN
jgi:hypothetical protein